MAPRARPRRYAGRAENSFLPLQGQQEGSPEGKPMSLEAGLLEILACPACHAPLHEAADELVCTSEDCGLAYPIRDGIPVLLVDEARRPA